MRLPTFRRTPDMDPDDTTSNEADRPVVDALERYAAESLSPDDATLARIGATVRAAFVETIVEREDGLGLDGGPIAARRSGPRHRAWNRRRAFAAICAVAVLTLSTFGFATAESGPGQPFYRLRLGIESVNLPPAGSQDRLNADLSRADARLDDVAGSAVASDWNAAADAADAYREVIAAITLPSDATAKAQALTHLDAQLGRLEQLRARSQGAETAALDGAIATLSALLGIPVPTPPASTLPVPSAHPTDNDGIPGTASAGATAGDSTGGRDVDRSPEPTASRRPGGPGDSDGGFGSGGPGSSGGDRPSPTPTPKASNDGGWPSQQPPRGGD